MIYLSSLIFSETMCFLVVRLSLQHPNTAFATEKKKQQLRDTKIFYLAVVAFLQFGHLATVH